jgi:hypothetical protein
MMNDNIVFSKELDPTYDLSVAGLEHALDILLEETLKLNLCNRGWYRLKIASQNLEGVFAIIYGFPDVSVNLDPTYSPDEWSLSCSYYEGDNLMIYQVHCDGT